MFHGVILILFAVAWFIYLRKKPLYGPRSGHLEDKYVSEETFKFVEKFANIRGDILAIIMLMFGLAEIYNVLAVMFDWIKIY